MSKGNRSKGFRSFVKEKGYYIVLLLCAAAVGVSGYFLFSDKNTEQSELPSTVLEEETNAPPAVRQTKDVVMTDGAEATEAQTTGEKKVARPVDGELINGFAVEALAYNTTTRDWRTHEGIDLCAQSGQEVRAAMDGSVYAVYEDEAYGMTVVLRHPDGYTTHYSNLASEVSVKSGDSVTAGSVLGTVGETAITETAQESHLHFAVYRNNVPVDPEEFLNP